jgi:hypothetical protein
LVARLNPSFPSGIRECAFLKTALVKNIEFTLNYIYPGLSLLVKLFFSNQDANTPFRQIERLS